MKTIAASTHLTGDQRRRLSAVIEAAAPPVERIAGKWCEPVEAVTSPRVAERAERWIRSLAGGDRDQLVVLLDSAGQDWTTFLQGLSDVRIVNARRLPAWARALKTFLCAQPQDSQDGPLNNPIDIAARAAQRAAQVCESRLAAVAPVHLAAEVREDFARQLVTRLVGCLGPALSFEVSITATLREVLQTNPRLCHWPSANVEGWLNRFEMLPGLGYVVGVTFANWQRAAIEQLRQLQNDLPRVSQAFWQGQTVSTLCRVRTDAGDPHDGGRSVTVFEFDHERMVVHKTRDLGVALGVRHLVELLNDGLPHALKIPHTITSEGYAWQEFVPFKPCCNEGEIRRFYFRIGELLRLLQLLEGRDFWMDNLIAHGEHPVFVDWETVLQPRLPVTTDLTTAERLVWTSIEESVVPTGAVSAPTAVGEGHVEDFGALAPCRPRPTPLTWTLPNLGCEYLTVDTENRLVLWLTDYAPTLHGRPTEVRNYLTEVVEGYHLMHARLQTKAPELGANRTLKKHFTKGKVRVILRDTWSYYRLLRKGILPSALHDGVERELALAVAVTSAQHSKHSPAIYNAERSALRDLDIPIFTAYPSSASLFVVNKKIHGFFEGTAWERFKARSTHPYLDLDEQLDFLFSALGAMDGLPQVSHIADSPRVAWPVDFRESDKSLIDHAVAIGATIIEMAQRSAEGLAWSGLVYEPELRCHTLRVLGHDLLSGTAGLAILFADLYRLTRAVLFRDVSTTLADRIITAAEAALSGRHPELPNGGYCGIGSQIYTLRRCAASLSDDTYGHKATTLAAELTISRGLDPLTGPASQLLAIAASPQCGYEPPSELIRDLVVACKGSPGDELSQPLPEPYAAALPTMRAARVLGLARSCALGLDNAHMASISATIEAERATDLELAVLLSGDRLTKHLVKCVAVRLQSLPTTTYEMLTRIELSLAATERTGDHCFYDIAAAAATALIQRYRRHHTWFTEDTAPIRHRLSVIVGYTAIAHALLRVARHEILPSLRLLK